MGTRNNTWGSIGCLALPLGVLTAWVAFTQDVPPQNKLVARDGTIETAAWSGRKHRQFVIKLAKDPRRYFLDSAVIKNKFGPPADLEWVGKHARLMTDANPYRFTGRTKVYSLELDGRSMYDTDELRQFYSDERPKILLLASALLLFGICILVWRAAKWAKLE